MTEIEQYLLIKKRSRKIILQTVMFNFNLYEIYGLQLVLFGYLQL